MVKLIETFTPRTVTRGRVWFAVAVAAATDAIQLALGPMGWFFVDQVLDVIAMVLISGAIGFHPLLLPTFVIELVPVVDLIPTWMGCTAAVVMLRKRTPAPSPPPSPEAAPPPTIDVASEVTRVPSQQDR